MNKVAIPKDFAAQILFDSDRTCCVCRVRGRQVQLHHIDEDTSNNDPSNIAVLCFDCHRDTQITGGFDRKLDAHQIIIYRSDWIKRIRNRRTLDHGPEEISPQVTDPLLKLIMSLPDSLLRSYRLAQPKWDTGNSSTMHEGNIDMIRAFKHILVDLGAFYPPSHFEGKQPEDYFREKIDSLFDWHSKRFDQHPGTVGFLVIVGGEVISDLEKMVADMVRLLTSHRDDFNFQAWLSEWDPSATTVSKVPTLRETIHITWPENDKIISFLEANDRRIIFLDTDIDASVSFKEELEIVEKERIDIDLITSCTFSGVPLPLPNREGNLVTLTFYFNDDHVLQYSSGGTGIITVGINGFFEVSRTFHGGPTTAFHLKEM